MPRLHDRLQRELAALSERGRRRRLILPTGIDFSSNDYLGLADDPRVLDALRHAIDRSVGHGSTGSRLLRGNHPEHVEAERRFAEFVGRERAILFGSGFAANTALLSALPTRRDLLVLDSAAHASLKEGARASLATRRSFPHNDLEGLEQTLRDRERYTEAYIVVEGIYSMEGDAAPLPTIAELALRCDAHLIVDEAHATGIYGEHLRGLHDESPLPLAPLATVHPCGKALGSVGAFIAADAVVIDYLVNTARPFLFSTAPSPLQAVALAGVIDILPSCRDRAYRLRDLSLRLRRQLRSLRRWSIIEGDSPIVPVVIGSDAESMRAAELLQRRGFDIRAIRPPTVREGTSRLRISLTSRRSESEIDALAQAIIAAEEALAGGADE